MTDLLWLLVKVGENLGNFILWLFLIAFLYNLSSSINKQDKSLLHISLIMMISYFLSAFLSLETSTYKDYFIFDLTTIFTLFLWRKITLQNTPIAFYYLILGLGVNTCLFLGMHYDVQVKGNIDYWWFWAAYGFGVILFDLIMALALFINKDFLGLVRLKNVLFPSRAKLPSVM
ncbi:MULTISPECIES: hypothetical protein [Pseudoalteromonas]|jgi:hypothetical protein|uniref:Membrane protein triplicated sequence n=2 Tax=Pseudoalteromonas TaxID=53246 RepID=A0AA37W2I4_9GAMM|nr:MULTISPECIES: hypothetical protein [Pseudoalteromonas]PHQ94927.1 MAG: hypothetical protein COB48_03870 [Pseudoalteromonas sp.]ADT67751.1 putative membrane protein; triplicated sequence [Pseudoalteromonas sp. SM9913]QWF33456.1 hypothetical protein KK487_03975 [Pseudoalteromonas sp. SiA1]SFT83244.1 hypothetical protein SAMN04487870_1993 [Pseudoalteromonas sp. DSM 26666]GEN38369.1 hypothetical protein PTE01_14790 [Pseudoalteromonas tetraodonis GFC]|tara:strand:- start:216 stop:737 length:522 start_codon:yes stop_codon:yes gene_type:complete